MYDCILFFYKQHPIFSWRVLFNIFELTFPIKLYQNFKLCSNHKIIIILTHCISVYANSSLKNLAKHHDTKVIGSISKYLAKYHYHDTKMGVLGIFPKIGRSIMILKWGC